MVFFADVGVNSDFRWCWRTKRVFTRYNSFLRYVVVSAWGVFTNNNLFPRHVPNHGRRHGGGRWVLGPTTFEIRWGRTHQIWEWSGPRPYIGGSHPAILPNRDVTRDASGAQNPSSLSLNSWKWPTFNKRWEKSWSAKTLKVYTFWKIDSRALTFSLRLFALGHSLFGNKEEKAPTFRRPQRANQRRAAPPPIDADWIWPWTPADSSRLTAQWTDVVTSDRWLVDSVPSRLPLKWPKSGVFSDF